MRISFLLPFLLVLASGVGAGEARALAVPGLHDTGVDEAGMPLAFGQQDLHYALDGPSSPAYGIVPHPFYVVPTGARWISPGANPSGESDDPVGEYRYTLSFDLTGLDLAGFAIRGSWSADNASSILLNGAATGFSTEVEGFRALHPFSLVSGFLPGLNTLEFRVTNEPLGSGGSPSGLLVVGLRAVPEPATAFLLAGGLAALARRRTKRR